MLDDGQFGKPLAAQLVRRLAGDRRRGAGRKDDLAGPVEFDQDVGIAEGQGNEPVAVLPQGLDLACGARAVWLAAAWLLAKTHSNLLGWANTEVSTEPVSTLAGR